MSFETDYCKSNLITPQCKRCDYYTIKSDDPYCIKKQKVISVDILTNVEKCNYIKQKDEQK